MLRFLKHARREAAKMAEELITKPDTGKLIPLKNTASKIYGKNPHPEKKIKQPRNFGGIFNTCEPNDCNKTCAKKKPALN
jgi:hypothetical protein